VVKPTEEKKKSVADRRSNGIITGRVGDYAAGFPFHAYRYSLNSFSRSIGYRSDNTGGLSECLPQHAQEEAAQNG